MQTALTKLGHKATPDGKYGKGTFAAVQAFQKANGLKVDGQAGPNTMKAIKKALAGGRPEGGPESGDGGTGGTPAAPPATVTPPREGGDSQGRQPLNKTFNTRTKYSGPTTGDQGGGRESINFGDSNQISESVLTLMPVAIAAIAKFFGTHGFSKEEAQKVLSGAQSKFWAEYDLAHPEGGPESGDGGTGGKKIPYQDHRPPEGGPESGGGGTGGKKIPYAGPEKPEYGRESANFNNSNQVDEASMNISMNGASAHEVKELIGILKNAGMDDAEPVAMKHITPLGPPRGAMAAIGPKSSPCGGLSDDSAYEADEPGEWDNSPDEEYKDDDFMVHDLAGGLNRPKKAYAATAGADNPMKVESIKSQLLKALGKKKAS